jgi:hypothetical protein
MRLIFTSGSREGQPVALDDARLTIGRDDDNDVQLTDEKVSRHHAEISRENGGSAVLRDLGSRNGTFVDEVRLDEPRVLSGGEQLRFGAHEMRVEADDRSAADDQGVPGRERRSRRWLIAGAVAAGVLVLLVLAQLFLPGLAEDRLRSDLERYGRVDRVHVEAFPAVTLLWKHADRVEVTMASYRSDPGGQGSVADFLSDTRSARELDARVAFLDADLVTLRDVRLTKDGDALVAKATLTQADLRAALPGFVNVRPVRAAGDGIVVKARGDAFGQSATARLRIAAEDGRIVVQPDNTLLGSFVSINVFKDPRVSVDSLAADLHGERYVVTARGHLR